MKRCYKCGESWESAMKQPGPKAFCAKCDAYLRCCLNCRFYDTAVSKQCQIPNIEYVADKEAGNFCDDFEFAEARDGRSAGPSQEAKDKLEGLFGDVATESLDSKLERFKGLLGD